MVEKNEKGREARRYFIAIEKQYLTPNMKPKTQIQLLADIVNAMAEAERKQLEAEAKIEDHELRIKHQEEKIKLLSSDSGYRTVRAFCKERGIRIDEKNAAAKGREASKRCKDLGYDRFDVADERHGFVKSYPIEVLEEVFGVC